MIFQRKLLYSVIICLVTLTSKMTTYAQLEQYNAGTDTTKTDTLIIPRNLREETYPNMIAGEVTPGKGFDLIKTKVASLNLSIYAIARYLNQLPGNQTWHDHLGNEIKFTGRNDFYWHRTMLWFSGFCLTPRLTYTATVWTIMTTQQTLVYGNIQYSVARWLRVGMGITPNLSVRSMQGPFPLYLSTDRTMGEESLRAGFTNGFFISGELFKRFRYTAMLGDNLST